MSVVSCCWTGTAKLGQRWLDHRQRERNIGLAASVQRSTVSLLFIHSSHWPFSSLSLFPCDLSHKASHIHFLSRFSSWFLSWFVLFDLVKRDRKSKYEAAACSYSSMNVKVNAYKCILPGNKCFVVGSVCRVHFKLIEHADVCLLPNKDFLKEPLSPLVSVGTVSVCSSSNNPDSTRENSASQCWLFSIRLIYSFVI